MKIVSSILGGLLAWLATASGTCRAENVALEGSLLAHKYCFGCHNAADDHYNIFDAKQLTEKSLAVKGKLSESKIWERLTSADDPMPPVDSALSPTESEKQVFKAWVEAGAPLVPLQEIIGLRTTEVLEGHCYDCHGGKATKAKLDIFAPLSEKHSGGGDPSKSLIWKMVATKKMPPAGAKPLNEAEQKLIEEWIKSGSPVARSEVKVRTNITLKSELQSIRNDLDAQRETDRPYLRYFSLRNVHNNAASYSDADLDAHRAALAKVTNSLSWAREIKPPTQVDPVGTLWRIDLRDYLWDQPRFLQQYQVERVGVWNLLCSQYPYGLSHSDSSDQEVRDLVQYIDSRLGLRGQYPVLRADWFCFQATQAENYYLIMGIQKNVRLLEQDLGVNLEQDFFQRKLSRFALKESGVSIGNRLMDRHNSNYGAYWISYDFRQGGAKNDLRRFPLGPFYKNHPAPNLAFQHDGGEIIFSLPNGLQGYALTDAKGGLLLQGPIDVVRDQFEAAGDAQVHNAISCMKCHAAGMKVFSDDIRESVAVKSGESLRIVEDLFDPRREFDAILRSDSERFQTALQKCVQNVGGLQPAWLEPATEPVGIVAAKYSAPLKARDAAIELDLPAESAEVAFRDSSLFKFGLAALSRGQVVKRSEWERRSEGGDSIYQVAAVTLDVARSSSYHHQNVQKVLEEFAKQK